MRRGISDFAANRDGAAAIEYGLIAAGIALAFLAAFVPFGIELRAMADAVVNGLADIIALTNL